MKRQLICISMTCLLILGCAGLWYASSINPLLALKGIVLMEVEDDPVIQLCDEVFISKTYDDFNFYLTTKGYELTDQHGRIYHYELNQAPIIITSERFTSRYVIWKVN